MGHVDLRYVKSKAKAALENQLIDQASTLSSLSAYVELTLCISGSG